MANALELIMRANPGRKPRFNNSGDLTGFRSVPGATQSTRNSMADLNGEIGDGGGLTRAGTWNAFFPRPEQAISLAPEAPTDAPDMAAALDEGLFNDFLAGEEPTNAAGYARAALDSSTKYFDAAGLERPAFGGGRKAARYGDNFSSPYGTGSVRPGMDYQEKLKRLTSVSIFDDPLFQ